MRTGARLRRGSRAWPSMSSGLVGSSIHHGCSSAKLPSALYRFIDAPLLVGVHHQLVGPADLFAHEAAAPQVVRGVAADLQLELGPALRERFAA